MSKILATQPIGKAVASGKSKKNGASFKSGDGVVFHVKHLHGLRGTVVMDAGSGQFVVRGNEEAIEGQLFQFAAEQLVSAESVDLKEHHSTRLAYDYPE